MKRKWYYLVECRAKGPFEWYKIVEFYHSDEISDETKVWSVDFGDWLELGEVLKQKSENDAPSLPSGQQESQPLPKGTETRSKSQKDSETPPPLPKEKEDNSNAGKGYSNVGPIQSKADYIAAQSITKISFGVLSIMGTLAVIGFLIIFFQPNNNKYSVRHSHKQFTSFTQMPIQWVGAFSFKYPSPLTLDKGKTQKMRSMVDSKFRSFIQSLKVYRGRQTRNINAAMLIVSRYSPFLKLNIDAAAEGSINRLSKLPSVTNMKKSITSLIISGFSARRVSFHAKQKTGIFGGEGIIILDNKTNILWILVLIFESENSNNYSDLDNARSYANKIINSVAITSDSKH